MPSAPPAAETKKPATPPPSKDNKAAEGKAAGAAPGTKQSEPAGKGAAQDKTKSGNKQGSPQAGHGATTQSTDKTAAAGQQRFDRMAVRAKLSISEPGDAIEREADAIADKVMRMPQPAKDKPGPGAAVTPKPGDTITRLVDERVGGGARTDPANKPRSGGATSGKAAMPPVSPGARQPATTGGTRGGVAVTGGSAQPEVVRQQDTPPGTRDNRPQVPADFMGKLGPGDPLDANVRTRFEQSLGHDLADVRVHTDEPAQRAARQINARAFTFGRHIAFAPGQYQPGTPSGDRLLAHELAHVLQQRQSVSRQIMRDKESTGGSQEVEVKGVTIPGFKFSYYSGKTFKRAPGYNRAEEGSKQLSLWRKQTKTARDDFPKTYGLAEDGVYVAVPKGVKLSADSQELLVGQPKAIADLVGKPRWDEGGKAENYDVDHMIELQVGGAEYDKADNLELRDASANRSSGSSIDNSINQELAKIKDKEDGNVEKIRAKYTLVFSDFKQGGAGGKTSKWSQADINKLEAAKKGLNIYDPDRDTDSGLVLGWPKGVDKTPFFGGPDLFVLYPGKSGGQPIQIKLGPDKKPLNAKQLNEGWIPGFKLSDFDLNLSSGDTLGSLKATLDVQHLSGEAGAATMDFPIRRLSGKLTQAGFISTVGARNKIAKALGVKEMSPVEITELDVLPGTGLLLQGVITPSLPLLNKTPIDLLVQGKRLQVAKTFSAGELKIPGPFKITGSSLTVALASDVGLSVTGVIAYVLQGLGEGTLVGKGQMGSFSIAGDFIFDRKLFDAQAILKASYTKAGDDGKFSAEADVLMGKKIRGIKSAKIHVLIDNDKFEADGKAETDIPGIKEFSVGIKFESAENFAVTGKGELAKLPGIKSGSLTMTLKREGEEWSLSGSGDITPDIPGVSSQLHGSYEKGVVLVKGEIGFSYGKGGLLSGNGTVGVTNANVDDKGNVSGEGGKDYKAFGSADLTAKLGPVSGTVKLKVGANGKVEIGGKLTMPDQKIFDEYPKGDAAKHNLVKLKTPSIPLVGIPFGGIVLFADFSIDAEASVGPGMVKNIGVELKPFDPSEFSIDSLKVEGGASLEIPAKAGISMTAGVNIAAEVLVAQLGGSVNVTASAGIPADPPAVKGETRFSWSNQEGFDIENKLSITAKPKVKFSLSGELYARANLCIDTVTLWSRKWPLGDVSYDLPLSISVSGQFGWNSKTGFRFDPTKDIKIPAPKLEAQDFLNMLEGRPSTQKTETSDLNGQPVTDPSKQVCEAQPEANASHMPPAPNQSVMPQRENGLPAAPPAGVDENVVDRLGTGVPLDMNTRGFFEQRLKTNLANVRVHIGPQAAREAEKLSAKAFTVGEHIAFAEGQYQPDTPEGRELLAHELAHVMQQQGGAARQVMRGDADRPGTGATPPAAVPAGPAAAAPAPAGSGRGPITLPELKLPELKYSESEANRHRKTAYDNALASNVERPAGYRRAEVDSRQRTLWNQATPAATMRTALNAKVPGLDPEKVYVAVPRSLTLAGAGNQTVVGVPNELALALRQPRWDRAGAADAHPFEIDHIVELQIGGAAYDRLDNLELLERAANGASGRAIDGFMNEAFAAYARSTEAASLPEADRNADVLKRQYRVRFGRFRLQGPPATGKRWTLPEVLAADPAAGLRIYDPANLTGPAPTDPNAILHPWPAGVDATRFTGAPNMLVIYASKRGGEPRPVPLRDGQPQNPAAVLAGWLPGIETADLQLTLGSAGDGPIGHIRGRLNHPQLKPESRTDVDVPIKRRRGLANAGILDTDATLERFRGLLRGGGVAPLSPVVVDEVDVLPGVGLFVSGRVEPTIDLIRNASLDFQIRGQELVVSKTFYGGELQLGGPFRIDGSDLTVGLGTRSGLEISGGVGFGIERLGRGTLRGAGRAGEFAVDGSFEFDRGLFDADARIGLSYRRGPDAPDGKLSGNGTVGIGEGKVRGIRRATVLASFDGEQRSLQGTAELDIPGVESATLGVQFTPENGTEITGSARFRDRPGIRNGQISATLTQASGGWTMAAHGSAESTFAGITAALDASYDNGLFKFSAQAPFSAGPASGNVLLGVTNGDVDDDGNVTGAGGGTELRGFGNGTVNVRITEHLQGGVGLKVRPSGDILVSGRIGIPGDVTLFDQYPSAENSRRELFRMPTVSVPLVGIAVGGNTVGVALTINGRVTGYAHIGPGRLTQAEIMVQDFNPAQPDSLHVTGGATFDLPAAAGVEASLDAGVSLGAAVIRATAGMNVAAAAGVEAHVTPHVDLDWAARTGLHVHGDLNALLSPQLRFSLNGYAEIVADAFVTSFTLWRKDWRLAERAIGSSLSLGLNAPVDYYSDERGVVFDPNRVTFQVPELNADTFAQLLNAEGSERVEHAPPRERDSTRAAGGRASTAGAARPPE